MGGTGGFYLRCAQDKWSHIQKLSIRQREKMPFMYLGTRKHKARSKLIEEKTKAINQGSGRLTYDS